MIEQEMERREGDGQTQEIRKEGREGGSEEGRRKGSSAGRRKEREKGEARKRVEARGHEEGKDERNEEREAKKIDYRKTIQYTDILPKQSYSYQVY